MLEMEKRLKKRSVKSIVRYILRLRVLKIVPDTLFLKIKYKNAFGKKLDLVNPRTFNEKLQWLKIHDRKPEYTKYVDKYEVRNYIKNTIGEKYLIPYYSQKHNKTRQSL